MPEFKSANWQLYRSREDAADAKRAHVNWHREGRKSGEMKYKLYLLFHAPYLLLGGHPEWGERWGAWPHCNGQARCWMHYSPASRWCQCVCLWCYFARGIRCEYGDRDVSNAKAGKK